MEDKLNPTKVPCPNCHGKGFYCTSDVKPEEIGVAWPVNCEICDGTGIKPTTRQGYWMYVPDGALCTVCGKLSPSRRATKYCPHCKSEMIIKGEDNT